MVSSSGIGGQAPLGFVEEVPRKYRSIAFLSVDIEPFYRNYRQAPCTAMHPHAPSAPKCKQVQSRGAVGAERFFGGCLAQTLTNPGHPITSTVTLPGRYL